MKYYLKYYLFFVLTLSLMLSQDGLCDGYLDNGEEDSKSTSVLNLESSEKTIVEDENDNSLEKVSFISEPASKTAKTKK